MTPYDFSLLYQPADKTAGIPQNTQGWLDARRGRVTASSRAFKLLYARDETLINMMEEMAQELLEPAAESIGNRYTEHGHAFEDQAIGEYQMMRLSSGLIVRTPGMFIHPEFDIASSTPDFFEGEDATGQIKCPYKDTNHYKLMHWGVAPRASTDGHRQYYSQVQFESFTTCRPMIRFVSYHPDVPAEDQLYIEEMEADEKMHAQFREKLDFINHMLVNDHEREKFIAQVKERKTVKGVDGIPDLF
jgi:hypothetical protein